MKRFFVAGLLGAVALVPSVKAQTPYVTNTLISFGSVWRYHDKGIDLGTSWRSNIVSDVTWSNGPAELGYGDNDEATRVEDNPTPGYDPVANDRYITTYFRHAFPVTNAVAYSNLSLTLLRDDAGVVYLNGAEIFRSPNLPSGMISYNNLALATG